MVVPIMGRGRLCHPWLCPERSLWGVRLESRATQFPVGKHDLLSLGLGNIGEIACFLGLSLECLIGIGEGECR